MRWTPVLRCAAVLGMFFASQPLYGAFHVMQIEQVIGGVQGDHHCSGHPASNEGSRSILCVLIASDCP